MPWRCSSRPVVIVVQQPAHHDAGPKDLAEYRGTRGHGAACCHGVGEKLTGSRWRAGPSGTAFGPTLRECGCR